MDNIQRDIDFITGTHRCHGQVLAYTNDPYALACEMMGKKDGFVEGMGGSQHIKVDNYITNGITGGMVTVAAGIAMGIKKDGSDGIVIAFAGDGGFNEGYVQESLNIASHFNLPILIVCENNKYAMSTPTACYSAGTFKERVSALNIKYIETASTYPEELEGAIKGGISYVRDNKSPCFIDIHTARLCGHSKSDSMHYMTEKEKEDDKKADPMLWIAENMDEEEVKKIEDLVCHKINDAFDRANNCQEIIRGGTEYEIHGN